MLDTQITIENEYGIYSVLSKNRDMNITECFETLVIPCLLAAGFSQAIIDEYLDKPAQ